MGKSFMHQVLLFPMVFIMESTVIISSFLGKGL